MENICTLRSRADSSGKKAGLGMTCRVHAGKAHERKRKHCDDWSPVSESSGGRFIVSQELLDAPYSKADRTARSCSSEMRERGDLYAPQTP